MVASFEIYIGTDFRKLQASSRWFKHTLDVSGVMKHAQKIFEQWGYHADFSNDFDENDVIKIIQSHLIIVLGQTWVKHNRELYQVGYFQNIHALNVV